MPDQITEAAERLLLELSDLSQAEQVGILDGVLCYEKQAEAVLRALREQQAAAVREFGDVVANLTGHVDHEEAPLLSKFLELVALHAYAKAAEIESGSQLHSEKREG